MTQYFVEYNWKIPQLLTTCVWNHEMRHTHKMTLINKLGTHNGNQKLLSM